MKNPQKILSILLAVMLLLGSLSALALAAPLESASVSVDVYADSYGQVTEFYFSVRTGPSFSRLDGEPQITWHFADAEGLPLNLDDYYYSISNNGRRGWIELPIGEYQISVTVTVGDVTITSEPVQLNSELHVLGGQLYDAYYYAWNIISDYDEGYSWWEYDEDYGWYELQLTQESLHALALVVDEITPIIDKLDYGILLADTVEEAQAIIDGAVVVLQNAIDELVSLTPVPDDDNYYDDDYYDDYNNWRNNRGPFSFLLDWLERVFNVVLFLLPGNWPSAGEIAFFFHRLPTNVPSFDEALGFIKDVFS